MGSTRYFYRVRSVDFNGNENTGILRWFVTTAAPDTIPPVILKGPVATNITRRAATILWLTDERTSCFVEYGTDSTRLDLKAGSSDLRRGAKVRLTNLEPNTRYYFTAISQDLNRNEINTRNNIYSFFTKSAPDTTEPDIIAGPVVARTTDNSAVIKWVTSKPANSTVEYGTDTTYAGGPLSDDENVRKHSIIINNLIPDTLYYAYVRSEDLSGNISDSRDKPLTFRTKKDKDLKKPRVIEGPVITNLYTTEGSSGETAASATIEWVTDEPADGFVKYGTRTDSIAYEEGESELMSEHSVTLTNLMPGRKYFYVINSSDIDGNKVEKTRIINKFRTPRSADTKSPVIVKGPIVYTTERSASFEWETDELSDSFIYYGIADSIRNGVRYEKIGSEDLATKHNVVVTNLIAGEEYIFIIASRDRNNNTVIFPKVHTGSLYKVLEAARTAQPPGGTGSFRTRTRQDSSPPMIIAGPTVTNKTGSTVTIEWETDEQGNSIAEYGTSEEYGLTKQSESNVTGHILTLTNLELAKTYNYKISSTDINGNGPSWSLNAAVTTKSDTDIIPPQIIAAPEVVSITDDQATVMWETDEPSDTYIEFSTDSTFGEIDTIGGLPETRTLSGDVTSHSITLTNLTADTVYYFRVASVDLEDNGPTYSKRDSFRTFAEPDTAPPAIIDGPRVVSFTNNTVTVQWTTDELSDSFVLFSNDSTFIKKNALRKVTNAYEYQYDENVGSAEDVTVHEITITNLDTNENYIYTVGSQDKSDNHSQAPDTSLFKTAANPDTTPPEVPENVNAVSGNKAVYIQWADVPDSAGDLGGYNVFRKEGQEWTAIATQITETHYYDTGLENGTAYEYSVASVDNVYPQNSSELSLSKSAVPGEDSVPTAPVPVSPSDEVVISNTVRPWLDVLNSAGAREPRTYTFAVATDSAFLNLTVYKTGVEEDQNNTAYKIEDNLDNDGYYYWRAKSSDGIFDSPWSVRKTFSLNVPVSVKLALFTGKAVNGIIRLNWETASEDGNAGFNIYRSESPGGEFVKLNGTIIPGNKIMQYKYVDKSIESGNTYYYKLESVNILGLTERYDALGVTAIEPKEYSLHQNFPNPFNPVTTIKFDLPGSGDVVLKIYNILGQEVKTLVNKRMDSGFHSIIWNGTNDTGIKVASGMYLYRLRAGDYVKTRKMIFLK